MKEAQINIKNIKSFILGNLNYYLDKIVNLPLHLKEQYYYRLYKCKDDCLPNRKCKECSCPILKKAFSPDSCNLNRFPNFLAGNDWKEYKRANNINEDDINNIIKEIENEIHKK